MTKEIAFSLHALDRVDDRLHMSAEAVKEIIDGGKAVTLGYEPGTRKIHLMFYSVTDSEYFVAVVDEKVGEVITVLPFDFDFYRVSFYDQKSFKKIKRRAKQRVTGCPAVALKPEEEPSIDVSSKYYLALYFRYLGQSRPRVILIPVEALEYPGGKTQLEEDPAIHERITRFAEENCRPGEYLDNVLFRIQKKAQPEPFNFKM